MAKKQGKMHMVSPRPGCQGATLREENAGRKRVNASSMLRMQHLQNLAIWAGGEASIPPLGALFGHHLATSAEVEGVPLDRSLFPCQRCETILQPGYNCTIRVEKNSSKARRHKKSCVPSQNNVVYTCHFCSHRNLKKGTPRGYMKELLSSRPGPVSETKHHCPTERSSKKRPTTAGNFHDQKHGRIPSDPRPILVSISGSPEKEVASKVIPTEDGPATPLEKITINLSEKKRKMIGSESSKVPASGPSSATTESGKENSASNRRRKKSWSSLKEIAKINEDEKTHSISNLAIPFLM